ncbi:MAG TPA: ribosome recycling factor [Bacillota bacterium]|jgi:ribosome recycling factor|nr:ribosome recycling factor [Bacillota bacterium]
MIKEVIKNAEDHMKGVIESVKKEFAAVRTGRANPQILDRVIVEYYGTPTPLTQLANVSAPEPRTLLIQPWDKSIMAAVEKAILKADLGLNPANDGNAIRLIIPVLTEDRRKELVKVVKKEAEEKRVIIRNLRRDTNEKLKALEKDAKVPEDEVKKALDDVQKLTDRYITDIDKLLERKEQEIMEV